MNLFGLCLMLVFSSTMSSPAFWDPAWIARAKQATALVISASSGEVVGSAFCVDTSGYFITSPHVDNMVPGHILTLVLEPGSKKERTLSARVVRCDTAVGLALLRTEKPVPVKLPLGDDAYLLETRPVVVIGDSSSKFSRMKDPNARPTIQATDRRITSLRRNADRVDSIQLDSRLFPGNTGGPVLDAKGRVIGMVTLSSRDKSGAVSVGALRTFLSEPVLRVDFPKSVPWSARHRPLRVEVAVDLLADAVPPDKLVLTLDDGRKERVVEGIKTTTGYTFEHPLLPAQSRVKLHLTLSDRELTCDAVDRTLHTAESTHLLSDLAGYDRGKGLLTRHGKTIPWAAQNENLTVYLAEKAIDVPMRSIETFSVAPTAHAGRVRYRLAARTKKATSTTLEGEIWFSAGPYQSGTAAMSRDASTGTPIQTIRKHRAFSGTIECLLAAPVTEMLQAGGGRYLLLRLDKIQQLAVFDVGALKVVKYLPLPEPNTLIAGGATTFVLALPEQKSLQRWRLDTFECGSSKTLSQQGILTNIAMGSGSEGPLMVGMMEPSYRENEGEYKIHLLDLETFDPIRRNSMLQKLTTKKGQARAWFSPEGDLLLVKPANSFYSVTLSETHVKTTANFSNQGYVLPGPKGAYFHTFEGLRVLDLSKITRSNIFTYPDRSPDSLAYFMTIPSTLSPYYLGAEQREKIPNHQKSTHLMLFVLGSPRPVLTLPETPELDDTQYPGSVMIDQRVHFVPQAGVLITIPPERNRLVARYIDIEALLKKADLDYFFVDSTPIPRSARGAPYTYRIHVQSKNPDVAFSCDTCPEGMTVGPDGLLSWNPPDNFEGQVPVVVTLRAGDGQTLQHAFTLEVVP